MRVSWIPAFAGMTGLLVGFLGVGCGMVWAVDSHLRGNDGVGCGSDGDGGDARSFDFAQDGRRGRRIGGSWGVTAGSLRVNGDGRAGDSRGNDGLGFLGVAIGGGFSIPTCAGMTGLVAGLLRVGCGMVWAVDSRLRGNDGMGVRE